MGDLAEALEEMTEQNVFVGVEGTSTKTLILIGGNKRLEMKLATTRRQLAEQVGEIDFYINNPSTVVIGWNIKNLFSHLLKYTGIVYDIESSLLDLRVLEAYLGINEKIPQSFRAAQTRLSSIVETSSWPKIKRLYRSIYLPLIARVVPQMECNGVINTELRKKLWSFYEVVGQVNGRMKCSKTSQDSFNPHSLSEAEREVLRPSSFDDIFMYFDFRHMEVSVLQWLSGDPVLGRILESGDDLYNAIWKDLTTLDASDDFRKRCKSMFLPIVFGQGVESVAKVGNLPIETAKKFVDKIYSKYSVAMDWISKQSIGDDGFAVDVFGKRRKFETVDHRIRNFVVQSPASLICLDKLVQLHAALKESKIGFHIHDGYILYVNPNDCQKVYNLAKNVLEAKSDLYPRLQLKVSCHTGLNLNRLKPVAA